MNTTQHLFRALDEHGNGAVTTADIVTSLERAGIGSDDPRLAGLLEKLDQFEDRATIDEHDFDELRRAGGTLLERTVKDELAIPQFDGFAAHIRSIYEAVRGNDGGALADYIPQLAGVAPDQFGVALCTIDGQRLVLGDATVPFSFQSSCKPILYCAALEQFGAQRVHEHVGREPSGLSFNELTLNKAQRPHNPMINAGAIMCTSLIWPELAMAERFENLSRLIGALAGDRHPGFNNAIFHSERDTADRNFALAHYMREVGAFPEETDIFRTLDLYFAACSIEITARDMAAVAATFANGGVYPQTGERVFRDDTVKNCLSMMYSCGMYDYSGEFAFRVGLPAKSAVSGVIMAVIPNVMGIAVWSPRLDECGNSVRGVDFMQQLVEKFNFHNYESLVDSQKLDPRRRQASNSNATYGAIQAASCGDVDELKRLVAHGHDLDRADYDGRTPLHLAAAEGQEEAVRYLLAQGVLLEPHDRWGNTPLDDAGRHGREPVIALLDTSRAPDGRERAAA